MSWKISNKAFSSTRSTTLSRLPSLPSVAPASKSDDYGMEQHGEPSHAGERDIEVTADIDMTSGFDADDEDEHDVEITNGDDLLSDSEEEALAEEHLEENVLENILEQEIQDAAADGELDIPPEISPQEQFRLAALLDSLSDMSALEGSSQSLDRTGLSYGHQFRGTIPEDDLLLIWPFPIPSYLLDPSHAGNRPNPYASDNRDDTLASSLLSRILPLLGHTLSGRFGVPRRAIELVLRVGNAAIRLAERQMFEKVVALYRSHAPTVPAIPWAALEELDPVNNEDTAPRTAAAALKSIGVDTHIIVHPQCRNSLCSHVFYEAIGPEDFHKLPPLCPECSTPLRRDGERLDVLFFPRRELWRELEMVLGIPGVEEALEQRAARKAQRDAEDAADILNAGDSPYGRVLREQDDGNGWQPRRQLSDNPALKDCLTLTVNLGIDWANPSSNRSAAAHSMGPITLFLADLPVQVRSSMSCVMVVGITPGPKEPKGENLHKLLLGVILELRSSQLNGVWVRTPQYPNGRLVRVILGCIIADRPAACMISGVGHYQAHTTPCARCLVNQADIPKCSEHPSRMSRQHMSSAIKEYLEYTAALAKDKEDYAAAQEKKMRLGQKYRTDYPDNRVKTLRKTYLPDGGHISALALIPGYDTFPNIPFDAMHAILEGLTRAYFYQVLVRGDHGEGEADGEAGGSESDAMSEGAAAAVQQEAADLIDEVSKGSARKRSSKEVAALRRLAKASTKTVKKRLLGPTDVDRLQELLESVQIPMSISRLHPLFGTPSAGKPSADDWRTFASVYAPLVLPRLFAEHQRKVGEGEVRLTDNELSAIMGICEVVVLALRSSISDYQLDHLREHLIAWSKDVYRLHPSLKATTNFHVVSHLVEDILRFGPPYNTWSFAVERFNYIAKNVPQAASSSARQVATMRAVILARQVETSRAISLDKSVLSGIELDAREELETAFQATNVDRATSTLDLLGIRYEDSDRLTIEDLQGHRAGKAPVKLRGTGVKTALQPGLHQSLKNCLSSLNIACRLNPRPMDDEDAQALYLPASITAYEGVEWGRMRFDSAEPVRSSSARKTDQSATQLVKSRNSLFEMQTPRQRYGLIDEEPMTGLVSLVFEHQAVKVGSQGERIPQETRLFAVVRTFRPYQGEDPYRYDRFSLTGTRLWLAEQLQDPAVMLLDPPALAGFRPLAIARLPIDIDNDDCGFLWATQPIDRH